MSDFLMGFRAIPRGYALYKLHVVYRKWILIPLFIDICLFFLALYVGTSWIQGVVSTGLVWMFGDITQMWYWGLIYYPAFFALWLALFFFSLFVTVAIANVLASPFYSFLAEAHVRVGAAVPTSLWRQIKVALRKAIMFGCLGVVFFVCSFFPILNIISTYLGFVVLALDATDYSLEVLSDQWRARMNYFKQHKGFLFGLGASLALTALVPGLILLAMPFAVLGASDYVKTNRI
jgi:CysZ protein